MIGHASTFAGASLLLASEADAAVGCSTFPVDTLLLTWPRCLPCTFPSPFLTLACNNNLTTAESASLLPYRGAHLRHPAALARSIYLLFVPRRHRLSPRPQLDLVESGDLHLAKGLPPSICDHRPYHLDLALHHICLCTWCRLCLPVDLTANTCVRPLRPLV